MDRPGPLELGRDSRRLRVETLWRLRWLAVAGQGGAVVAARFAFGFPLPLWSCLGVVAALAAFNLALRFTYPMQARLGDDAAMAVLAFDVLQLAALLFLTGGLQNPFALLFLAPVMISATALPPARTLALLALTVAATSTLAFRHLPLPWFRGETVTLPFEYALGAWA
ncbi:MAG: sensor histidine kinase, partial [Hyphomicrobiales bacterium]|nr:sensor histidine kinase [Hyphomicrobiales bacterium]